MPASLRSDGGHFQPDSVVNFNRNAWSLSAGIDGHFQPERVVTLTG